jgi:peptidoglycan/LPS O-acetylase OafA/YrhL
MRSINDCFDAKRNNFDVMRLAAAILVLCSHSYPLSGSPFEPVYAYLGRYDTGGGIAVTAFFIISGFLITRSAERQTARDFVAARVLRIVPALAVVAALQYLILGPFFTTHPLPRYLVLGFDHLRTALVFTPRFGLPGVFPDLPVPAVNGSLWTLPTEAFYYLVVGLMAFAAVLTRRSVLATLVLIVFAFAALSSVGYDAARQGPTIFIGVQAYYAAKLGTFFFIGAACWMFRDRIPLHPILGVVALIALAAGASLPAGLKEAVLLISLPYLIFFVALWRPVALSGLHKLGDISYGTYLYAFPIQQTIVASYGPSVTPWLLTSFALGPTLILAWLSSRLVERPALQLKELLRFSQKTSDAA